MHNKLTTTIIIEYGDDRLGFSKAMGTEQWPFFQNSVYMYMVILVVYEPLFIHSNQRPFQKHQCSTVHVSIFQGKCNTTDLYVSTSN